MAVYNGEKFIERSINAILSQNFEDFEFIIVDDGSTDNTLYFLQLYSVKDKRIRIIKNKYNIGLTKSLNKAIKVSKGNYIARQDVDDYSLKHRLEKQFKFLESNPNYKFCGSNVFLKQNRNFSLKIFNNNKIREKLLVGNRFIHSTMFLRNEVFDKYGLYNEKWIYGQDYELWCRLIYKYNLKAKILKDKLVVIDIANNNDSKTYKKLIIQHLNYIKTRLIYLKYFISVKIVAGVILKIFKNILEILAVGFKTILLSRFKKLKN